MTEFGLMPKCKWGTCSSGMLHSTGCCCYCFVVVVVVVGGGGGSSSSSSSN